MGVKEFLRKYEEKILLFSLLWTTVMALAVSIFEVPTSLQFVIVFLPWILMLAAYFLPIVLFSILLGAAFLPAILAAIVIVFIKFTLVPELGKELRKRRKRKGVLKRFVRNLWPSFKQVVGESWALLLALVIGYWVYTEMFGAYASWFKEQFNIEVMSSTTIKGLLIAVLAILLILTVRFLNLALIKALRGGRGVRRA